MDKIKLKEDEKIVESHVLVNANTLCRNFQIELGYTDIESKNFIHEPEDPFNSLDDAALAWSLSYNGTIPDYKGNEYLSKLYKEGGKFKFSNYVEATEGYTKSGDVVIETNPGDIEIESGQYIASIHSHPAYADLGVKFPSLDVSGYEFSEYYSPGDLARAIAKPAYLLTPMGRLQRIKIISGYGGSTSVDHYLLTSALPKVTTKGNSFLHIDKYSEKLGPKADSYKAPKAFYPTSVNDSAKSDEK